MAVKSTSNPKSRYVQGGTTDIFKNRLGWWERKIIPRRDDDIRYVVTNKQAGKPWLISNEIYKTPDLMWLVLQYNNILDPTLEIIVGKELFLPSPSRVLLTILTR